MASSDFSHVTHWVFDLDNTLYPPSADLFGLVEPRMTHWISAHLAITPAEADHLREDLYLRHGSTVAGLVAEHRIAPDPFLDHVHDVPMDHLRPDPALAALIRALPGRRVVHTNAPRAYAARVLAARGLDLVFDAVYGVEDAEYQAKPRAAAFEAVFARDGIPPHRAAMFEDDPRNLLIPHERGMKTVLVGPGRPAQAHIHHQTADLTAFLTGILHRAGVADRRSTICQ